MSAGRPIYFAVLMISGIGWGATQALGKIAVSTGHGPFGLILWQFVIGALLLGGLLALRRKSIPLTRQSLVFGVLIALIGTIIPNTTSYISFAHLPAGIMSLVIATVPLLSFALALALGADRPTAMRLAGLGFGFAGVALIALPGASLPSPAMAAWIPLALIGPLFYAIESNYVSHYGTGGLDAMQAMCLASLIGIVFMVPITLATGQFIDPREGIGAPELALILSSAVHTMAYCSYVWLASKAGAVFAAQTGYIVTGSGLVWAMIILDERYGAFVWLALALMMIGITLVQPRQTPVDPAAMKDQA